MMNDWTVISIFCVVIFSFLGGISVTYYTQTEPLQMELDFIKSDFRGVLDNFDCESLFYIALHTQSDFAKQMFFDTCLNVIEEYDRI